MIQEKKLYMNNNFYIKKYMLIQEERKDDLSNFLDGILTFSYEMKNISKKLNGEKILEFLIMN